MTDTEAKALALVNEIAVERGGSPVDFYGLEGDIIATALCRAIEREAATEARHAAELREQAEQFSEAVKRLPKHIQHNFRLAPFILPAPDPLVEAWVEAWPETPASLAHKHAAKYSAAMQARGYEWRKIGEAGE